MRQSHVFGQTARSTAKDEASANAVLLSKAGFVSKVMAGVYAFLPLGLRVLTKIENIVREEMNAVGQEVLMPALSPKEIWETSKRLDGIDVLLKVVPANKGSAARNTAEYVLNPTHEDVITWIAAHRTTSHKDLPFAVYQIQTKYRNEERPKGGLLRAREFRMKDLYSFHTDQEDMKRFYEDVRKAYERVFHRLGIGDDTYYTAASGGDFTDEFSHEFQTICPTGEDTIFVDPKTHEAFNKEVAPSRAPTTPQDTEMREKQDVHGKGIVGVAELSSFLKIPASQTTKTLIYTTAEGAHIAAAVRGDYDVNEIKLAKAAGTPRVWLADEKAVRAVTGAAVGYAGLIGLADSVAIFVDDSLEHHVNFEIGGNKTNYHIINANWERDIPRPKRFYDIKIAKEGDTNPATGSTYTVLHTSEVGNIFPLNTKFSKAFQYTYTDASGKQQFVYMASYGIGTSRTMGVIVEKFHDEHGIIWPRQIAPFHVHLLDLTKNDQQRAEALAERLEARGFDVLLDDRATSPGVKLKDADLIGIPVRLILSEKTKGDIEWKIRAEAESRLLSEKDLVKALEEYYADVP